MDPFVQDCLDRVLAGAMLPAADLLRLADDAIALDDVMAAANAARAHYEGDAVHFCSIVNAKMGNCSENCSFCSQSAHFDTGIETTDRMDVDAMLAAAKDAAANGASCFGVVTATRGVTDRDVEHFAPFFERLREETDIRAGGSLGFLKPEHAKALADAGMEMVNHNLETSRRRYAEVCTTHTYDDRLATLRAVRDAGMAVCSGVIFGMGEDWTDRVDVLLELRDLEVECLPLNFLDARPGTPLEGVQRLSVPEILRCIALARLAAPRTDIKVCGGRESNLGDSQTLIFKAGASGALIGNYLTTLGRAPEEDRRMVTDQGLRVAGPTRRESIEA